MVPIAIVRAYVAMMPRLRADESLLEMERAATGNVTLVPEARTDILKAWQRQTERRDLVVLTDATSDRPVRRVKISGNFPHRKVPVTRG